MRPSGVEATVAPMRDLGFGRLPAVSEVTAWSMALRASRGFCCPTAAEAVLGRIVGPSTWKEPSARSPS